MMEKKRVSEKSQSESEAAKGRYYAGIGEMKVASP